MSGPLLYSTNVYLKYHLQNRYYGNVHYVWCSEAFDSSKLSAYSGTQVPPSSDPSSIYRELLRDVSGKDTHSAKITAQKASFQSLALRFAKDGRIDKATKEDILYMIKTADFSYWRPLLYVIPRAPVEPRMKLVPMKNRAGFGDEFIIADLRPSEFDVIEF